MNLIAVFIYIINMILIFSMSDIISTMISCSDLDTENELFNVLKTADNYYVKGDTFSLNQARMATMAKFVMK